MYALEQEPETGGRMRILGAGALIAVGLGVALVVSAQHLEPARHLLARVVPITMVDLPAPPKPAAVEPPPPELPKTKPPPKPKSTPTPAKVPAEAPEPTKQSEPPPETVGLDASSFGEGAGGPAFHAGTTQMGVPTGVAAAVRNEDPAPVPAPKLVEARPRPGNRPPPYSSRARRLNIQGLMVIEADVDARGRVTRAVVRGALEPELDEAARKAVERWTFEPATLAGRPVASTKFLRIRFELH